MSEILHQYLEVKEGLWVPIDQIFDHVPKHEPVISIEHTKKMREHPSTTFKHLAENDQGVVYEARQVLESSSFSTIDE